MRAEPLLLLLLTGCGPICDRDPYLNRLYMEFLQIVPMQEANVCSIIVADTGPDAVGTATSDSAVRCDVRIGPGQSEIVLKMVIAHEAVHCLGYGHTSLPNHIMNPHILPERYIIKHLDRLYKDLIEYVEWDL